MLKGWRLVTMGGHSKLLLLGLFLFFYLPLAYWSGWDLLPGTGLDFPSYYYAARFTFLFHITPYGIDAFKGIAGFMGERVQPYIYPPPSLLFFWPLAYFSVQTARAAFLVFSHLCYLGCIWLMLFRVTGFPRDEGRRQIALAWSLVYLLSMEAVPVTFGIGQVNLVALFFVCLALAALRRKSAPWWIALPLSVAVLLKTYPVFLLPILLFRRQFRAAGLTCLFAGVVTVLAYLVLPGNVWSSWFIFGLPAGAYGSDVVHGGLAYNQSMNAFAMRLFSENFFSKAPLLYPFLAKPAATVLALIVAGVTLFFSFRSRRLGECEDDEVAAFLLMIYMIAPISWDHHLVYIMPACVLAISLIAGGSVGTTRSLLMAAALFLIAWRVPIGIPSIKSGWWTLLISAKLYAVLALWLFFIGRMRRFAQPEIAMVAEQSRA